MALHYGNRNGKKIEWIVCHYPVMPGCDAKRCLKYYQDTNEKKSAHYAISVNQTVSIVPCKFAAWHCCVKDIKTYCDANNWNSIGIDLMDNKISKKTLSVNDKDWYIPEATLERAAYLISYLMKRYNIPIDHVIRHYDVTHKCCPRPLVGDDINEYYSISGNQKWEQFKQRIMEISNKERVCTSSNQ